MTLSTGNIRNAKNKNVDGLNGLNVKDVHGVRFPATLKNLSKTLASNL